jgi:hypothetical protein
VSLIEMVSTAEVRDDLLVAGPYRRSGKCWAEPSLASEGQVAIARLTERVDMYELRK